MEGIVVKYLGQEIKSNDYVEISDEELQELKKQFFEKPTLNEVKRNLKGIASGDVSKSTINRYYFRETMSKVRLYNAKWTIEELFQSKELVGILKARTLKNKDVFPDDVPLIKNMEKSIQIGGAGFVKQPTDFPIKTVDEILRKYNVNDNYYDFSCGWGARLLGSLKNNINYFGTDVNYELTEKLCQMANDYNSCVYNESSIDIRTQGSEIFIPEWENKMGIAFSSPPYFCLEDYQIGNQSYKKGTSYESWLENYLRPTIKNIYKYLIDVGYFIINIKDFSKYELEKDTKRIAEEEGFELFKIETLENIVRCTPNTDTKTAENSERIFVFTKKGVWENNNLNIYDRQLMFF